MKRLLAVGMILLTSCAHLESTRATYSRPANGPSVLRITRHMDTVVRGPDIEEDQVLVLELRALPIGKRLTIPSEDVTARFSASRFGPSSKGDKFKGYLLVRSVTDDKVVATLKLEVVARTADDSYVQTERFRGEYTFIRD